MTLRTDVAELGMRHYLFFTGQLDSLDNPDYLSRYASTTISLVSSPRSTNPTNPNSNRAGFAPGAQPTPPPPAAAPSGGGGGGGSGPLFGGGGGVDLAPGSTASLVDAALAPPAVQTVTPVLTDDDVDYFPPIKYGSYGAVDPSPRGGGL